MGKSKGSQRTKGNVRPSSSGHTAELLGSSGRIGFIGFGTSKIGQHVSQECENGVDSMFSMVMKKMLKRDNTTKLKAIQEFKDLICEKDKDTVISILPFWPRLFNKLSLDFDRRIREATQEANAKLIEKVKRDIAPYLKNITGVWLLSQCDTYAPAASLSKSTFFSTFPAEKQSEALMFCKDQILTYFNENLFEQTPETLAEPYASPEEIENKYVLVIAGTLQGLRLFLTTISDENKKSVLKSVKGFISVNKFWKFAKHKSPQIRVSWYNLISVLCHDMPEVFDEFEHKLGCIIFNCLSEADPAVISSVWEAALNYVVSFQNCWESIDIQKVVIPHLWDLLKNGGKGNAVLVYPCLLPFLSKLPSTVTKGNPQFLITYFNHLLQSLFLDTVKKSTIECNAIVTAYIECLQYVSLQCKDESDISLLETLICEQLASLVEKSFIPDGAHLPVSKFYQLLGHFLLILEQNRIKESSIFSVLFNPVLLKFWESINNICSNIFQREHSDKRIDLVYLTYLFHCIYEPLNNSFKPKKTKVRFSSDHSIESDDNVLRSTVINSAPATVKNINVFKFTVKTCYLLCTALKENFNAHYMKLFYEILSVACSSDLFHSILQELGFPDIDTKDSPIFFFENFILKWLQQKNLNKLLIDDLVEVLFIICSCTEEETTIHLLNSVCKIENPLLLNGVFQRCLSSYEQDEIFQKWLKSENAVSFILLLLKYIQNSIVLEMGKDNTVELQNVISFTSTLEKFFSSPISKEKNMCIEEILLITKKSFLLYLVNDEKIYLRNVKAMAFFCYLCEHILHNHQECWNIPIVKEIMNLLFDCSLIPHSIDEENLRTVISRLWLSSINHLPNCLTDFHNNKGFIAEIVEKFHSLLLHPKSDMTSDLGIVQFLREFQTLHNFSETGLRNDEKVYLEDVLQKIFPSENEWIELRHGLQLNLLPLYLEKKIFYPLPNEVRSCNSVESIPSHIFVAQLLSDVIVQLLDFGIGEKSLPQSFAIQLPHLVWAFSYCEGCDFLKKEGTNEYIIASKLQRNCFDIFTDFSKDDVSLVLKNLYNMCCQSCFEWEMPFQNTVEITKTFYPKEICNIFGSVFDLNLNDEASNSLVHQIIIQHLDIQTKRSHLSTLLNELKWEPNVLNLQKVAEICACLHDKELFLFGSDLEHQFKRFLKELLNSIKSYEVSCENVNELSLIMLMLHLATNNWSDLFSATKWNDVISYVIIALEHCYKVKEDICRKPSTLVFIHRTCSFVCMILSLFSEDSDSAISLQDWKIKLDHLSESLILLFYGLADISNKIKPLPKIVESVLTALSQSIEFLPTDCLLSAVLKSMTVKSDQSIELEAEKCEPIDFPLEDSLKFLTSDLRPLQLCMHMILIKSMKLFPALLKEDNLTNECNEEISINKQLMPMIELLKYTSQIVETMLSDLKIGECCIVLPNTDSYTYTLAYLFAWSEFLEFLDVSAVEERSSYVKYLENNNLFQSLLSNLFRLMPEKPTSCLKNIDKENATQQDLLKIVFIEPPSISLFDSPAIEDIHYVACSTYYNTLKRVPAVVRMWWNNLDKKSSEAVNKFTTKNISSLLASKEIQAVHESDMQVPNMTIRARVATREVMATYTIDNSSIELTIQLPVNYPLGPIAISDGGKIKISKPELRLWLVQLTTFLTFQNGSVLSGLLLWKKNLDKKYEGKEECMICFYILNSTTGKLPEKSCSTCRKKFHSDCIYKWFVTSNNSTCPLCRCYF